MKSSIGLKLLIIAFLLGSFLRLWQLGQVPPSPDWDEVALGYNAYSILKTGKDEYGTSLPLSLRSYDDYKPPLYMYFTIPSVALFGLNTWSVRLPSALLGISAVIGAYLLTQQLTVYFIVQEKKKKIIFQVLPGLVSLLLAISPWHLQFSRIAFEANLGLTLNIWAIYYFLKGIKKGRFLLLSIALFGLGLYAYHSERIFVPLLMVTWIIAFRHELWLQRKYFLGSVVVGTLVTLPLVPVLLDKTTLTRLQGTSSLADQTRLLARSVAKLKYDRQHGNIFGIIFDNRRLEWARILTTGYLSHYSLKWLFLTGDNPRHHAPDLGLLYLWEMTFLFVGIYVVARQPKLRLPMLGWFFVAPIAASPTTELPHAIRSLVFLPSFQIFTAVGLVEIGYALQRLRHSTRFLVLICGGCVAIFNIIYYLHMYFVHLNIEFSRYWQYGYEQAVEYAYSTEDKYKKIVVSTKLEQPHMFFLFYLKYDPKKYLVEGGTSSGGFAEKRNKFGKYEFRPIHWDSEIKDGSILYIGQPKEIQGTPVLTIKYLDGSEAIRIASH